MTPEMEKVLKESLLESYIQQYKETGTFLLGMIEHGRENNESSDSILNSVETFCYFLIDKDKKEAEILLEQVRKLNIDEPQAT